MGEDMIGREVEYNGKLGVVTGIKPAKLVNVETGIEREAVRFRVKPMVGRAFWTCAMSPADDEVPHG